LLVPFLLLLILEDFVVFISDSLPKVSKNARWGKGTWDCLASFGHMMQATTNN
jgi:hypothetical protein